MKRSRYYVFGDMNSSRSKNGPWFSSPSDDTSYTWVVCYSWRNAMRQAKRVPMAYRHVDYRPYGKPAQCVMDKGRLVA